MKTTKFIALASAVLLLFACEKEEVFMNDSMVELKVKAPTFVDLGNTARSISSIAKPDGFMKSAENYNVELLKVEYITIGDGGEMGNIVFFKDLGNKKLGDDFVPGFALDGTDNISYSVDDSRPSADLNFSETHNAIDRAMGTWNDVTCSDIGLFELPNSGNSGWIAKFIGDPVRDINGDPVEDDEGNLIYNFVDEDGNPYDFGGSYDYFADINHVGWMPADFFDILAPGGSTFILGATFTLIFPGTDFDNNGKPDVAFREIYYNDAFTWKDGSTYDVETIALHEAGHGLSQGHFGKAFGTFSNQKVHFAPRAVMNASYTGVQTSIGNTDNAGHCANWASWPSN